jgi:hypothetical protein
VILCPFLRQVLPPAVCECRINWVPHPGIRGRPRSVLAVLGDPHRRAGVGVDHGPRRADDQARGAPFCWRRCCVPAR